MKIYISFRNKIINILLINLNSYEYTWTDSQKKNVKFAAPKYVDFVMTKIQNLLNDESVFPTKSGNILLLLLN